MVGGGWEVVVVLLVVVEGEYGVAERGVVEIAMDLGGGGWWLIWVDLGGNWGGKGGGGRVRRSGRESEGERTKGWCSGGGGGGIGEVAERWSGEEGRGRHGCAWNRWEEAEDEGRRRKQMFRNRDRRRGREGWEPVRSIELLRYQLSGSQRI